MNALAVHHIIKHLVAILFSCPSPQSFTRPNDFTAVTLFTYEKFWSATGQMAVTNDRYHRGKRLNRIIWRLLRITDEKDHSSFSKMCNILPPRGLPHHIDEGRGTQLGLPVIPQPFQNWTRDFFWLCGNHLCTGNAVGQIAETATWSQHVQVTFQSSKSWFLWKNEFVPSLLRHRF